MLCPEPMRAHGTFEEADTRKWTKVGDLSRIKKETAVHVEEGKL